MKKAGLPTAKFFLFKKRNGVYKNLSIYFFLWLAGGFLTTGVVAQPAPPEHSLLSKAKSTEAMALAATKENLPDLELVRQRVVADLLQPAIDKAETEMLLTTLQPDGSWPGINYRDTSKTGFEHARHLEGLFALARAYRKPGQLFYGREDVKQKAALALNFWLTYDFRCENWWWNEMGTPGFIVNTLLVLDSTLNEKQCTEGAAIAARASLTAYGARAGGDFVPMAGMVAKQALFLLNDSLLQRALKVMADQVFISTSRGINPDMGFHHRIDNVTSIHTYGTNYVKAFAHWAVLTAGTVYALPDKALTLLIDYYLDGVTKSMAYGIYPDPGARNRDLSRKGILHAADTEIPVNLMQASAHRKTELLYLVALRKGQVKPALEWSRFFWHSAYFAQQGKSYFTSVRMHSARHNNVETPYNNEGLKMHHLADGANFISRSGTEYNDVFPVWDWQKIPGTTVVQKPEVPHWKEIPKQGLTHFVGGITNGRHGAAAFDFKSVHDPLQARKAWFFFDGQHVCLGAGIQSDAPYPVTTTLNQALLRGEVLVHAEGETQTLANGTHELKGVRWLLHDSIAYLFPTPASVQVRNSIATGRWRDINHQVRESDALVQKKLFTAWVNHGSKPKNEGYAYIVAIGRNKAALNAYSKNPDVVILANTAALQAVQHKRMQLTQVVFYEPGTLTLPDGVQLTVSQPCLLMVQMAKGKLTELSVADPTQLLPTVELKINRPADIINADGTWNEKERSGTLTIKLPENGEAGKTVVLPIRERQ